MTSTINLLAGEIDAACLTLMEAMETLARNAEALTAPESNGAGAIVAVAHYATVAGDSMAAAFLKPNGYCPSLNEVALGDFHTIDKHVRAIARPPHGLPEDDPHHTAQVQAAARRVETALAELEALIALEIGDVHLSFRVSSKNGVTRLDEARWSALPIAIEAAPKPGFLAASTAISRMTDCLRAAGMTETSTYDDFLGHIFRRPLRRAWPAEIRRHDIYAFLAAMPRADAPDEATARQLIDIAIEAVAMHGHSIAPSRGRDTFKLSEVQ